MLSLHMNACVRRVCVHCSVNADRLPAWVLICSRSGWGPKARPYHLSVTEKGITAVLILDHKSHSKIERRRGWWWRRAWQWEKNGRKTVKLWYKRYECDCVCVCCHFCSVLRLPSIHSSTVFVGWDKQIFFNDPWVKTSLSSWPFHLCDHPHALSIHTHTLSLSHQSVSTITQCSEHSTDTPRLIYMHFNSHIHIIHIYLLPQGQIINHNYVWKISQLCS